MSRREVLIEGWTREELLSLTRDELDALVFCDEPVIFRAGSAEILGQFRRADETLTIELGHIEGGGEGVLASLVLLARRYAEREGLSTIEWRVHAVHCANPNLKLQRVLKRRGFRVTSLPGLGECYHLVETLHWHEDPSNQIHGVHDQKSISED